MKKTSQDEELGVPFLLHILGSKELVFHIQTWLINLLRDAATSSNKLLLRIRAGQKQQQLPSYQNPTPLPNIHSKNLDWKTIWCPGCNRTSRIRCSARPVCLDLSTSEQTLHQPNMSHRPAVWKLFSFVCRWHPHSTLPQAFSWVGRSRMGQPTCRLRVPAACHLQSPKLWLWYPPWGSRP